MHQAFTKNGAIGGNRREMLTAYWISLPDHPTFPLGFGILVRSEPDAMEILDVVGHDVHCRARRLDWRIVHRVDDVGLAHVSREAGPIVVRGLWYPCANVGFGAS